MEVTALSTISTNFPWRFFPFKEFLTVFSTNRCSVMIWHEVRNLFMAYWIRNDIIWFNQNDVTIGSTKTMLCWLNQKTSCFFLCVSSKALGMTSFRTLLPSSNTPKTTKSLLSFSISLGWTKMSFCPKRFKLKLLLVKMMPFWPSVTSSFTS